MLTRTFSAGLPLAATTGTLILADAPWAYVVGASVVVGIVSMVARWWAPAETGPKAIRLLEQLRAREAKTLQLHGALDAELFHLKQKMVDPRTDARRIRLQDLNLRMELGIGDRRVPVGLRDLSLHDVFVDLPSTEPARWTRGLPVRVTLHHEGAPTVLGWATATQALRTPDMAQRTWRLVWRQPLRPDELPGTVRRATVERDAHRVAAHPQARVSILEVDGPRHAAVADLSANGIGLRTALGLRDAGRLPRMLDIELTLPMADPMTIRCELCHMDVRAEGTLLGLKFDTDAPAYGEQQARIAAHVLRRDAHTFIRLVRSPTG